MVQRGIRLWLQRLSPSEDAFAACDRAEGESSSFHCSPRVLFWGTRIGTVFTIRALTYLYPRCHTVLQRSSQWGAWISGRERPSTAEAWPFGCGSREGIYCGQSRDGRLRPTPAPGPSCRLSLSVFLRECRSAIAGSESTSALRVVPDRSGLRCHVSDRSRDLDTLPVLVPQDEIGGSATSKKFCCSCGDVSALFRRKPSVRCVMHQRLLNCNVSDD